MRKMANAQAYLGLRWVHMSEGTFFHVAAYVFNLLTLYCVDISDRNCLVQYNKSYSGSL